MKGCTNECTNKRANEYMDERMNEWMNEWANRCMNEWLIKERRKAKKKAKRFKTHLECQSFLYLFHTGNFSFRSRIDYFMECSHTGELIVVPKEQLYERYNKILVFDCSFFRKMKMREGTKKKKGEKKRGKEKKKKEKKGES